MKAKSLHKRGREAYEFASTARVRPQIHDREHKYHPRVLLLLLVWSTD